METIVNKKANIQFNKENGNLCITGVLANTMVYLYDINGELSGKYLYLPPSLNIQIPQRGTYVLVVCHSNRQPEVKRIVY